MPRTQVILYRDDDATVPLLEWLDGLTQKAQRKCRVKIGRLAELGHELRRPEADLLRDGIYELRVGLQHVNYRMLYFFHGRSVVVLSHGFTKRQGVPATEIERALRRKQRFEANPEVYTHLGDD